jgi:alginate O-acetyltransferase complex protein AlgJ
MRTYWRHRFLLWLGLSFSGVVLLPGFNFFSSSSLSLTWSHIRLEQLFTLDHIHAWRNYLLYRHGISADTHAIVVGKQGWLFLGNAHGNEVNKQRGLALPSTRSEFIHDKINILRHIQSDLEARNIAVLFVIAPNKSSIYPEYLPDWVSVAERTATDEFSTTAQAAGLALLDLRPLLLQDKKNFDFPLYYRSDSHWNQYGAALSYQHIMRTLKRLYNLELKMIDALEPIPQTRIAGDLAHLLKIDRILGIHHDDEIAFEFEGKNAPVCIKNIETEQDLSPQNCIMRPNSVQDIGTHHSVVFNADALNPHSVLWLRDSFGNDSSPLFQRSFHAMWQAHHTKIHGDILTFAVDTIKPHIVIFQWIERDLL